MNMRRIIKRAHHYGVCSTRKMDIQIQGIKTLAQMMGVLKILEKNKLFGQDTKVTTFKNPKELMEEIKRLKRDAGGFPIMDQMMQGGYQPIAVIHSKERFGEEGSRDLEATKQYGKAQVFQGESLMVFKHKETGEVKIVGQTGFDTESGSHMNKETKDMLEKVVQPIINDMVRMTHMQAALDAAKKKLGLSAEPKVVRKENGGFHLEADIYEDDYRRQIATQYLKENS
jgi:hypothetical protein